MREWTSINDERPIEKINPLTDDFSEVVCAVNFGSGAGRDVRVYKYGNGHFWHGPQIMDGIITHWMYLPELPELPRRTPDAHAKWIEKYEYRPIDGHVYTKCHCSECFAPGFISWKECRGCGAIMDEK